MKDEKNMDQELLCQNINMVKEGVMYCTEEGQGGYTLEDYYALPDEKRVELIDGVFYDMAAPTLFHQFIIGKIFRDLTNYIDQKGGSCMPFMAPVDVQLDCDDRTMVQPDVLVICDPNKMKWSKVYGAPDLVVEVLSESTKRKDMNLKLRKYLNAGVKEYWMIDPEKMAVLVYDFQKDVCPQLYGFDAVIPVGIWEGECKIDFNEIHEKTSVFYQQMEEV